MNQGKLEVCLFDILNKKANYRVKRLVIKNQGKLVVVWTN